MSHVARSISPFFLSFCYTRKCQSEGPRDASPWRSSEGQDRTLKNTSSLGETERATAAAAWSSFAKMLIQSMPAALFALSRANTRVAHTLVSRNAGLGYLSGKHQVSLVHRTVLCRWTAERLMIDAARAFTTSRSNFNRQPSLAERIMLLSPKPVSSSAMIQNLVPLINSICFSFQLAGKLR